MANNKFSAKLACGWPLRDSPNPRLIFDVRVGHFVVSIPAEVVERSVFRLVAGGTVIRALRDSASISVAHPASAVMERVLLSFPVLVLHPRC